MMDDLNTGIAVLGALGTLAAVAAYVSDDGGGGGSPTFNIGEGFGSGGTESAGDRASDYTTDGPDAGASDESEPWQDTTTPDGTDTSETDVGEYLTDGFNYEDRTGLVDDDNSESDGGTWVGL